MVELRLGRALMLPSQWLILPRVIQLWRSRRAVAGTKRLDALVLA